ncbi:MAG: M24 family metallopeptidase [Fuerstiella sp.]|jgi:Xaa-Pro aminopeptidase|nr:M24 family metallopeptidase [Fuerstiella sp.]
MNNNARNDQRLNRPLAQDVARLHDVELKHERVRQLLNATDRNALLLQSPENIAWFTAGVDPFRCASEDCTTSLFVTPDARLFATNSVDSAQIFEREAYGLGFQLKQREWFQPHQELVADLCRSRNVLSDQYVKGARYDREAVRAIRLPLTDLEVARLRRLSRIAVHAVEATGQNLRHGVTEAEVAGQISHRLLKRTTAATRIQVCADGRNERYRHWTFGEHPINNFAVLSCIARRWGLHVGVTRTVCLENVPGDLWKGFQQALLLHATGIFFSRAGQTLSDVWERVHRIYDKFGMSNEWQLSDQADVIGYSSSECQLTPDADYRLASPAAVFWHSSVGPAMVGDTILLLDSSNEQLTRSSSWPYVPVQVKGREVLCPGILRVRTEDQSTDASSIEEAAASPDDSLESREKGPAQVESFRKMNLPTFGTVPAEDG